MWTFQISPEADGRNCNSKLAGEMISGCSSVLSAGDNWRRVVAQMVDGTTSEWHNSFGCVAEGIAEATATIVQKMTRKGSK